MAPVLYTIGNFTIDDIVFWPSGRTCMNQPGGNVLFSGLGARMWLECVGLMARLGNDYPPARLREIEARGFSLTVCRVDVPTLHDWILYEADGARRFVNHLTSGSNEAATPVVDEIQDDWLHGRGYHVAPMPTGQQAAIVEHLYGDRRVISLDPHEFWITGWEARITTMLAKVDLFLPSEIEAKLLSGSSSPQAAARQFGRLGPRIVAVKLGSNGSLLYEPQHDRFTHVPAYPAAVEDTTGAGDAYCGGFLAGYLLTGDPVSAAQFGTVSASYVVEAIGALSTRQPTGAERLERLDLVRKLTRAS